MLLRRDTAHAGLEKNGAGLQFPASAFTKRKFQSGEIHSTTKWGSFCTRNSMTRENRAKITVFTLICIEPYPITNWKHLKVFVFR